VEKVLASGKFADSPRMKRFVRFTVEEALNGAAARLKEIVIGAEVFDRDPSYDPRFDPIVRVEARRLRAKLQAYYEREGKDDPVIVEFPKGRYSPVFRARCAVRRALPARVDSSAIAVLPFANLGPEPDSGYFSNGLSEELIHALTRIPGLRVVVWHSGSIRRQFDVAFVLRGSVRITGERLRITAQLIDTSNGRYLWSAIYDRQIHDVFAVQAEAAATIVAALNPHHRRKEMANENPVATPPQSGSLLIHGL
jgi:TolB-like protein